MTRLSRAESQARTCDRLLEAAATLFARDGYAATSVGRIAEAAGFTKGAVYSNFAGKEAIFLAVLEAQGRGSLDPLCAAIAGARDAAEAVEHLAAWADERSRSGNWSLTILEHARLSAEGAESLLQQERIIRGHWQQLGACLLRRFPAIGVEAETLGALLHEIAYAPALTFVARPSAGTLMRLAVAGLIR